MRHLSRTRLALAALAALGALCTTPPALAQSNDELLKELRALKERVNELEKKLQAQPKAEGAGGSQWGMTPDQVKEFNRIAVKTEALEDSRDAQGMKNLKISGYMDPTIIWNKAQNRLGAQFLNRVDQDGYNYDNSYFGAAVIDFTKETDSGARWRLTLAPNRGVGTVFDGISPIHEASVSIPLSDLQTRFIAGQLPDWSGYEYLQPTLNKLITHNLLFDFTLPTAYTGVGMDITRGKWIYKAMLGNMNKSMKDAGQKSPVLAYRVDYSRGEFQGFGFAGVHGKAANFTENVTAVNPDTGLVEVVAQPDSRVDLFEFDAYFIRGDVTLQGQISYGRQKQAAITPAADGSLRDAKWWGLSGLAAYKFTPRLEGIMRADFINNKSNGGGLLGYATASGRNGIGPGWSPDGEGGWVQLTPDRGVNRSAITFGLSYLFDQSTTLKAEYRLDHANGAVFWNVKDGSYSKNNQLLGASVLVAF
jgi:hypothetical protein